MHQALQYIQRNGDFPYAASAVNFDGTNDWLTRGAGLTGAADSQLLTFSAWFNPGTDGFNVQLIAGATTVGGGTVRGQILRSAGNAFQVLFTNAAGTTILNVDTGASSVLTVGGWYHIMGSFDLSDTAKRWLYLNDISSLATITTYTNDTIDFTVADYAIGAKADGTTKITADVADLWFDNGTYLDLSIVANRRLFISDTGKPVYLGPFGEYPNGVSPIVFMSGFLANWATNKGTGGGFTTNGALTESITTPSSGGG